METRPIGRPRIIGSPEDFDAAAKAYFDDCAEKELPLTITGLALGVGLSSRQQLDVYQGRPEFTDSVKKAKARVEAGYEMRLHGNSPTGAIFALKNMQWSDKQEIAHSGRVEFDKVETVLIDGNPAR
jgi:DNA-packaging protein gp3